MSFVETIVVEFIADHLYERRENSSSHHELFDRLKEEPVCSNGNDHDEALDDRPDHEPILEGLLIIDREFKSFIEKEYKNFSELTEPLVTRLKSGSEQRYYQAFKTIADEIFAGVIKWEHIVTFLVYSAELVNKIIDLPNHNDQEKTFKMVSQIIRGVCRYFDENLLQWIDQQQGGWNNIIESTKGSTDNNCKTSCRGVRQYIGVAAFAVVIGGLYMCSKLTAQ